MVKDRLKRLTEALGERLELVRGSGNVFRDLGRKNADVEQLKAPLAAETVKALDREELTYGRLMLELYSPPPISPASEARISQGLPRAD